MKKQLSTAFLLLILLTGISLLLYPTVSNWWNSYHQSRAIVNYAEETSGMEESVKTELLERARAYNRALAAKAPRWLLSDEEWEDYLSQLDVTGTGIMGYIEIPQIECSLPIYHGTGEEVLSAGVGHIEGSSLPVGGAATHAVLSGHRGLPSAKLLTNLDRLTEGDVFYLHVLEETLAYEVDQIVTVEPDDLEELNIQEQQDYCTLVTCTPYGINSHRLLVRGHRVVVPEQADNEPQQGTEEPQPSGRRLPPQLIAAMVSLVVLVFIGWLFYRKQKRKAKAKHLRGK